MLVITEARQLATDLRAVLGAPAADEWNRLHLLTLKDSLLARLPAIIARLEYCRDETNPDQQAQIRTLIDDLKAMQLRGVSP